MIIIRILTCFLKGFPEFYSLSMAPLSYTGLHIGLHKTTHALSAYLCTAHYIQWAYMYIPLKLLSIRCQSAGLVS